MVRLVVFIFLMSLSAFGLDQNLVTLDGGAVAQICATCTTRQARFPVSPVGKFTIKKVSANLEQPVVLDAAYLAVHVATPPSSFAAKWEVKNGLPIAIVRTARSDVHRPGTYHLVVAVQPNSDPRRSRLKLQVTQP